MDHTWGTVAMDGHVLTEIHAACYWTKSTHTELQSEFGLDNQDTALDPSPAEYFAVLGNFTFKKLSENLFFPPSTAWLTESQYVKYNSISQGFKAASLKTTWKLKDGNDFVFLKYNIYVEKLAKQVDENATGKLDSILGRHVFKGFICLAFPFPVMSAVSNSLSKSVLLMEPARSWRILHICY
jgi:mannosyl-glycoprotein endo-beta-N-acetylglucosaminidase